VATGARRPHDVICHSVCVLLIGVSRWPDGDFHDALADCAGFGFKRFADSSDYGFALDRAGELKARELGTRRPLTRCEYPKL